MVLSKLAAKCRACPFVDSCGNKEMEAYGFLPFPTQQETIIFLGNPKSETAAQTTIQVNMDTILNQSISTKLEIASEVAKIYANLGAAMERR